MDGASKEEGQNMIEAEANQNINTTSAPISADVRKSTKSATLGGFDPFSFITAAGTFISSILNPGAAANTPSNINPELGEAPASISRDVQEGIDNPGKAMEKRDTASAATTQQDIDIDATNAAIDAQMRKNREETTNEQLAASDERRNNMLSEMGIKPK